MSTEAVELAPQPRGMELPVDPQGFRRAFRTIRDFFALRPTETPLDLTRANATELIESEAKQLTTAEALKRARVQWNFAQAAITMGNPAAFDREDIDLSEIPPVMVAALQHQAARNAVITLEGEGLNSVSVEGRSQFYAAAKEISDKYTDVVANKYTQLGYKPDPGMQIPEQAMSESQIQGAIERIRAAREFGDTAFINPNLFPSLRGFPRASLKLAQRHADVARRRLEIEEAGLEEVEEQVRKSRKRGSLQWGVRKDSPSSSPPPKRPARQ